MSQIIDQNLSLRQYVRGSLIPEPVDYSNSRKNVQACGNFATTGHRPELRDLELSQNTNLSKLERDFRAWKFKNPDSHDSCPARFTPVFDSWERKDLGDIFKVRTLEKAQQVRDVAEAFKKDKPGMNKRRAQELRIADRFRGDVADLGPMETIRGGKVFSDYPHDVANRLSSCRQAGNIGLKPGGGHIVIYDQKCGYSKLCPDESRAESMRIAKRYVPIVEQFLNESPNHTMLFLVPTMPNSALGSLSEGKTGIFHEFRKLLERKCCSGYRGALAIEEDPLSAHGDWNPHLNVIMLVDGRLDWGEIRKAWGYNIDITSAARMIEKTKNRLKKKGMDTSDMSMATVLAYAFMELSKYAGAPLTSKSASKSASGESKAPPMCEWPAPALHEWFTANKWFRRTRNYGVLYDLEGYRWGLADESLRREWLGAAGLDSDFSKLHWRRKLDSLTKDHRGAIRKIMDGKDTFDINLVEWIGQIRYIKGEGYQTPFDLIQGDKLGFSDALSSRVSQDYCCKPPTGPPPDASMGDDVMDSWDNYCVGLENRC